MSACLCVFVWLCTLACLWVPDREAGFDLCMHICNCVHISSIIWHTWGYMGACQSTFMCVSAGMWLCTLECLWGSGRENGLSISIPIYLCVLLYFTGDVLSENPGNE